MVVPDGMDLEPDPDSTIHEVRDDAGNLHRLGSVRLRHRVVRDAEPEVQSAPQTSREDRARLQAALESGEHEGEDRERILGRRALTPSVRPIHTLVLICCARSGPNAGSRGQRQTHQA